jgi:anthranilate phosphoribosyltransferase
VSVRQALEQAASGREVEAGILESAFGEIADGKAAPAQVAGLLVALRTKGETVAEIAAIARALRARAETAPLADPRTLDTCGTGGDGAATFNISTLAAFVVAGAGVPVAKHGNRAASSRCGSADLLEALGVDVELDVARAAQVLAETGIAFFFARRAHPAFRFVAPVRQELGIRTVMNCMGPLLSPVGARRQLVGVYDRALVEALAGVLLALGSERALVVHGEDGLDEVTTTGVTHAAWVEGGRVEARVLDPAEVGLARAAPEALAGGDPEENARIAREVLGGAPGPRRDVVLANAGAALWVAGEVRSFGAGVARAAQSLDEGAARARLEALVRATNEAPA